MSLGKQPYRSHNSCEQTMQGLKNIPMFTQGCTTSSYHLEALKGGGHGKIYSEFIM